MSILRSCGIPPEPPRLEQVFRLPKSLLLPLFACAFRTAWAETVIAEHAATARAEMRLLAGEFLAFAADSGKKTEALRSLAAFA